MLVGPIPAGRHRFIFEDNVNNLSLIPERDITGETVALITCTYHRQELFLVTTTSTMRTMTQSCGGTCPQARILSAPTEHHGLKFLMTHFHINWDNNADNLEAIENKDPALSCSPPPSTAPLSRTWGSLAVSLASCLRTPWTRPNSSCDYSFYFNGLLKFSNSFGLCKK